MMRKLVIAIDGPAGSGKSTTARMVADKLGMLYLDTGAMYRAITLKAIRLSYDPGDENRIADMARKTNLRFEIVDGKQQILLDDEDVSTAIRRTDVTAAVSPISAHRKVREILVAQQQEMGINGGIVAEGRDTTSVVFPDANLKIYLTASLDKRAERRLKDMLSMDIETSLEEQLGRISKRDQHDSTRAVSPLKKVEDAKEMDTSSISIEDQVNMVIELAEEVAKD